MDTATLALTLRDRAPGRDRPGDAAVAPAHRAKRAEAAYERAAELTRALDRYAYHVEVRFDDSEIDQARAAGVVIEFDRHRRSWNWLAAATPAG